MPKRPAVATLRTDLVLGTGVVVCDADHAEKLQLGMICNMPHSIKQQVHEPQFVILSLMVVVCAHVDAKDIVLTLALPSAALETPEAGQERVQPQPRTPQSLDGSSLQRYASSTSPVASRWKLTSKANH
eukprot:1395464-Pleurochrysis_carterae.AAC.2